MSRFMLRGRRAVTGVLAVAGIGAPLLAAPASNAAGAVADFGPAKVSVPSGREVSSLATARSRTWIDEKGQYTTKVFARQVNVRQDGAWRPIDNTLRGDGDGGFEATRGAFDLTLPSSLDEPARVADGDDWLELELRGSDAEAKVDGATATYAGAGEGVTAKLTANNAAFKEDLVLASAAAQTQFSYDLRLSGGLRPVGRADGGIEIRDAKDDVVFSIPAPVAADGAGVPAPEASMTQTVKTDGEAWVVSLSIDRAWLSEAGRAFPVVLDPSVTIGTTRDCSLRSSIATTQCANQFLQAGRFSSTNLNNALTYFDLVGQIPQAAFISSARLSLVPTVLSAPGAAKSIAARDVSIGWDNNATWSNRTASAAWTAAGGDFGPTDESSVAYPSSTSAPMKWPITDLVTRWMAKPNTNLGVAVTDNGSAVNGSIVFGSSDNPDSTKWPVLELTYWPRTGQPGNYTIDSQSLTDRSSLGVNVASGNLMLSSKELGVAGTGLSLDLTRFYNSGEEWQGMAGQGGRFSLGQDVVLYECDDQGGRCLVGPNGFRVRFKKNSSGAFVTPPGIGNVTLTKLTTGSLGFELKDNRSGTVMEFFNATYSWMTGIRDKNGVSRINLRHTGPNSSLDQITDSQNRTYDLTADSAGRIKTVQIPASRTPDGTIWQWKYTYNAFGFLTSVEDPTTKTTSYDYDATSNKLNKITDPRGNETLITYDTANRVTSVTRKIDGTTTNDITTLYAYTTYSTFPVTDTACQDKTLAVPAVPADVIGKTVVTDPNGNSVTYCYDQNGAVLTARDGLNRPTSTTYTQDGNVSGFAEFGGSTSGAYSSSAYTYGSGSGAGSNPTMAIAPAKETTEVNYLSSLTGDLFKDAQPETVVDPQGDTTRFTYDSARANVTKIENERGSNKTLSATLTWDTANKSRLATSTDKEGHTTTYSYSTGTNGGDLTMVSPHNSTVIGPTEYTYDGLSRVTKSKDGRAGKWVDYTYDKLGRQLTTPDSDGLTQTVTYDNNGNVLTRSVPAASQYSSYSYDKLNRKTSETLNGATTTYTYDKGSNLKTLTDASGTVTYGYDASDRLTLVRSPAATGGGTEDTTYGYTDPASVGGYGTVTTNLPGGTGAITQTFDTSGKIANVVVYNGTTQTYKQLWTYQTDRDANSSTPNVPGALLESTTIQNGGTSAPTTGRLYGYLLGQLTSQIDFNGGTATDQTLFTYDQAGNRTSRVKAPWPPGSPASSTKTYAYNENNQLCWTLNAATSVKCLGKSPGGISGLPSTTAPYGAPPTGATTFTYDDAGNQTGYTGGPSTTWDAKARIDAFGSGYSSILSPNNNELVGLAGDTYTNTALGISRITSGGTTAKLVREPGGGTVVSQIKGTDKSWFVTDQIGSTTALVAANGTIQRSYAYDVDGNDTTGSSGPTTAIKYAGGHDVGNGLYHFGARYYQPSIARWTQMDPLLQPGDLGQANRYLYVGNNSVNAVDPAGLARCPKAFAPCPKGIPAVRKALKGCAIGAAGNSAGPQLLTGGSALVSAGSGCVAGIAGALGAGAKNPDPCFETISGLNKVLGRFDCDGGTSRPLPLG